MDDCAIPCGYSLGMPKKTNFRLTACKGTFRTKHKKLPGVPPQIDLKDKEEDNDVEPSSTCNDNNHALAYERIPLEEDPSVYKT